MPTYPGPWGRCQPLVRLPAGLPRGSAIAQTGRGRASPGPGTLWKLARTLDVLFPVLAGAMEPADWRRCADRVLVKDSDVCIELAA